MNLIFLLSYVGVYTFYYQNFGYKTFITDSWIKVLVPVKGKLMIKFINMARQKKIFPICNTTTVTLIMFMLQITKRSKEQYLDTLAVCNYDKDLSLLLLEFLSAAFSLLVIMLQTNSSLNFLPLN